MSDTGDQKVRVKDALCEDISALIDGEVGELELHRVLKQAETDDGIRGKWARYNLASAVLKNESLSGDINLAFADRVRKAVADEQQLNNGLLKRSVRPLGQAALAASVAFLVIFGLHTDQTLIPGIGEPSPQLAMPVVPVNSLHNVQLASEIEQGGQDNSIYLQFPSFESDQFLQRDNNQQELNDLMLQHARQATYRGSYGFVPYARVSHLEEW
jgi:sigma-E factor negative regulatory protein RseA